MQISKHLRIRIVTLTSSVALAAGLGITTVAVAGDMGYVMNPAGEVVRTGYGECWKGAGGKKLQLPECGDAPMDADGDGVPDDKDKCPDTPKGAPVDENGCPLDSDGDGVADYMDKCPDTPAGAAVNAEGCPADSDGDGVPDYMDKCPGTKPGAKVDASGCEVIGNVVIDSVQADFDFDSAKLKPSMTAALDTVVAKVKASRGDEKLLIVGHTDSIGSDAYNKKLSLRRAQAVADYLVGQGLDRSRMTIKGMGEAEPVADNKSEAGRSKNRRVEIKTM
ncbi:MAG TPA: OmpA family protein [Chromatiales bacterium]|nr:OmpA family protein [Chromatiales bacterium]